MPEMRADRDPEPLTTEEILARPHKWDEPPYEEILDEVRPGMHYDREGRPISLRQWCKLHDRIEYVRVAEDTIGPYWISTVWLGLDHGWGEGPPMIFETMVFGEPEWHDGFEFKNTQIEGRMLRPDFDQRRYSTLREARIGHAELVTEVKLFAQLHSPEERSDGER